MASGKRPKYKYKRILNLSSLFTIKSITSVYNLYHLENCFYFLYVCIKIVTQYPQ